MQEHRRTGWYIVGGAIMSLGASILTAWSAAAWASEGPNKRGFFSAPFYIGCGLFAVGAGVVVWVITRPGPTVINPLDWEATREVGDPGSGLALSFRLTHRRENMGVVMGFTDFRLQVTDPVGTSTEASVNLIVHRHFVVATYEQRVFPGAPPPRNGTYRYIWSGEDSAGVWHEITRGTHEVDGFPPG
jgi:hypothetical protein